MSGWNGNTKNLLINWSQQITINEIEHRYRGTVYKRLHQGFNTFSLISQTGALSTLIGVIADTAHKEVVPRELVIYITVVEIIAFIIDAIGTCFMVLVWMDTSQNQ